MAGDEDMTKSEQYPGKFSIGPSEEEINRRKGPAWQHTMPDIRMQDQTQKQREDEEDLRRRLAKEGEEQPGNFIREQDPFYGLNRNFQRIIRGLERLQADEVPEVEKTKIRERLPVYHENLAFIYFLGVEAEINNDYLRFDNPVPYDTRTEDFNFEGLQKAIKIAFKEEEWARSEEARYWLLRVDRDIRWMAASRDLIKGMAALMDKHFDWDLMLQQVKERFREDPLSGFYEITFKRNFRGPELPSNEHISDQDKEKLALRERGVRYHSQNRFWSMAVASVHQGEYDSQGQFRTRMGKFEENGKWKETLSDKEREFIRLLFGTNSKGGWINYDDASWAEYKGRKVPHKMLNWQAMKDTLVNKERYIFTMSYLLAHNIKDELNKPEYRNKVDLRSFVRKIKTEVDERRKTVYTPDISYDQLFADVVVKSGIIFDWGHKTSVHTSWGYNYNEKGERVVDSGGTTIAMDQSGFWWREFYRSNVGKGWPKSILPDMDWTYVNYLENKPPDYKPTLKDLNEVYENEGKQLAITEEEVKQNELSSLSYRRLKSAIQEINPALWEYLKDKVWYWVTPYKDKEGRNLVLPIWTPPTLESINYWKTIPFDPRGDIKDKIEMENGKPKITQGDPSVWDALLAGEDLSEKEWGEVDESQLRDMAYYVHLVTLGQTEQLLNITNSGPELIGKEMEKFFLIARMLAELRKRGDLGDRDEEMPFVAINVSFIPLLINAATAHKRRIIDEDGASSHMLGEWVSGDLEEWRRSIEFSTPQERVGMKGYRDAMLAFFDFYATQFILTANSVGLARSGSERRHTEHIIKIVKEDTSIKVDYISPEDRAEARIG